MAKFRAAIRRGFLALRTPDESIDELKRFKTALRSPKRDANWALELVDEQLWLVDDRCRCRNPDVLHLL
jgi:hypothetical protein